MICTTALVEEIDQASFDELVLFGEQAAKIGNRRRPKSLIYSVCGLEQYFAKVVFHR